MANTMVNDITLNVIKNTGVMTSIGLFCTQDMLNGK